MHTALVLVGNLNYQCRVLGKQQFHYILLGNIVEVYLHTPLCIGEAHFEQCCYETTGRYIVSGHDYALVHKLLHSIESLGKIFRILHSRHIVTNAVQCLRESRTSKAQHIETEVDVVERTLRLVNHYRRNHLAYIGNLATGRYDYCTRADYLCTVGIFLCH